MTYETTSLETLRAAALAVQTFSGISNAWAHPDFVGVAFVGGHGAPDSRLQVVEVEPSAGDEKHALPLAQFYAAANPAVVLDLLDHLADLEAQLAQPSRTHHE